MDSAQIAELTSKLGEEIGGLRDALEPLTKESLNDVASKLPVLDRAKLYTMAAYSLESILFSNLRLAGVDAKSHQVFTELARVRQYFSKIKAAESGETKPRMTIDKAAITRMIKYELASNNRVSKVQQQQQGTKRKFDDSGNVVENENGEKAAAEVAQAAEQVAEQIAEQVVDQVAEQKADGAQEDFVVVDEDRKKGKKDKKEKKDKKAKKKKKSKKDSPGKAEAAEEDE